MCMFIDKFYNFLPGQYDVFQTMWNVGGLRCMIFANVTVPHSFWLNFGPALQYWTANTETILYIVKSSLSIQVVKMAQCAHVQIFEQFH